MPTEATPEITNPIIAAVVTAIGSVGGAAAWSRRITGRIVALEEKHKSQADDIHGLTQWQRQQDEEASGVSKALEDMRVQLAVIQQTTAQLQTQAAESVSTDRAIMDRLEMLGTLVTQVSTKLDERTGTK